MLTSYESTWCTESLTESGTSGCVPGGNEPVQLLCSCGSFADCFTPSTMHLFRPAFRSFTALCTRLVNETRVCKLSTRESISNLGRTGSIPSVRCVDLIVRFKDFNSRNSSDRTDLTLNLANRFYEGLARFDATLGIRVDGIKHPSII